MTVRPPIPSSRVEPTPRAGLPGSVTFNTEPTAPAAAPSRTPLVRTVALLSLGSVALAGLLGFGLSAWLGASGPWATAAAAAVGVLGVALPLSGLVAALARQATQRAAPPVESAIQAAASLPMAAPLDTSHGAIHNREQFMDLAQREWSRSRRYGTGASVLLVEIDRYPRLVGVLGAAAGELVLKALADNIARTLRGADALARYEQGQIAVFLAHADATGSLDVAERIRERAEQMEVALQPKRVRFTVAVGVSHLRPAHLHLQALLDDAVDAVVAARTAGGNCVRAAPVEASQLPPSGFLPRNDQRASKG